MVKIAICISGQIRNDDSALMRTMDSLAGIDADIFISVWRARGTKTFGGASGPAHMARIFGPRIAGAIPKNWLGRMRQVFPDSGAIFPSMGEVTQGSLQKYFPEAVIDIEDEVCDLSFPYSDSNSLRMLYKIWRCNGMKKKQEQRSGQKYDLVVRMRPDLTLDMKTISKLRLGAQELVTHTHQQPSENYVQDIYWVGSTGADDEMAGVFTRALACQKEGWGGIHVELAGHIRQQGLTEIPQNYLTGNIHHFAIYDPAYAKAVQHAFVEAVTKRQMDVEFAGGAAFCALADVALQAALAREDNTPVAADAAAYMAQINQFSIAHKPHARIAQIMGLTFLLDQQDQSFEARFSVLLLLVKMQSRLGLKAASDSLFTSLPVIFAGTEDRFVAALTRKDAAPWPQNPLVPAHWEQGLSEEGGADLTSTAIETLLRNSAFCNWVMQGADVATHASGLAEIGERRVALGVRDIGNYRFSAKAYGHMNDAVNERKMLLAANAVRPICSVNERLGQLAYQNGDFAQAIAFLKVATGFGNCPERVRALLKECEAMPR